MVIIFKNSRFRFLFKQYDLQHAFKVLKNRLITPFVHVHLILWYFNLFFYIRNTKAMIIHRFAVIWADTRSICRPGTLVAKMPMDKKWSAGTSSMKHCKWKYENTKITSYCLIVVDGSGTPVISSLMMPTNPKINFWYNWSEWSL